MPKSETVQSVYIIERNYIDDTFHIKIRKGSVITNQISGTKEDWNWIKKALDKLYREGPN